MLDLSPLNWIHGIPLAIWEDPSGRLSVFILGKWTSGCQIFGTPLLHKDLHPCSSPGLHLPRSSLESGVVRYVIRILVLFTGVGGLLSIILFAFIFSSFQPTFNGDSRSDVVLITRYDITPKHLSRGDVVSLWYLSPFSCPSLGISWLNNNSLNCLRRSPDDPEKSLVKRIIALEGDLVKPRPNSRSRGQMIKIPKGHCWVEGDNWKSSRDSNSFGPVSPSSTSSFALQ